MAPDKVKDKTFDDITAVLLQHYKLKPLVISECFNFNRRKQAANELVADCVAELRRLSAHCEFGTFLDDGLRDRYVCGLRSEAVHKLLVEISLTFTCAVEIAQNMESAASKVKQLQSQSNAGVAQRGVYKMSGEAVTGNNSCYRCGRQNHQPSHCPSRVLSAIIVASRVTFSQFAGSPSSPLRRIRDVEATGTVVQEVRANQRGQYKKNRFRHFFHAHHSIEQGRLESKSTIPGGLEAGWEAL